TGPLRMPRCGHPALSGSAPRRTSQRPPAALSAPLCATRVHASGSAGPGAVSVALEQRTDRRVPCPGVPPRPLLALGTRTYSNRRRWHPAAGTHVVASTKSMLSIFRRYALRLTMRNGGARPPTPARAPSATRRRTLARAAGVCVACVALFAPPLAAQLRPLEPLDWRALEPGRVAGLAFGAAAYRDQRASLAGTQGRLLEVGNFAGV